MNEKARVSEDRKGGILKLKNILEGLPEPQFSSEEYMMLYTNIYNMCIQKPPNDYSKQLYEKYKDAFVEYLKSLMRQLNGGGGYQGGDHGGIGGGGGGYQVGGRRGSGGGRDGD